ncbi:MAG: hypothetical protein IBX55_13105, partial [Methyloprofundus sp.]|nr:hypothetical protein [Methyloprofundus sp.]
MPAWTLEEAKSYLQNWIEAEVSVSTGQSYKIGSRTLTRASLTDIRERISFWRAEVGRLESGRKPGARVMRIIPR